MQARRSHRAQGRAATRVLLVLCASGGFTARAETINCSAVTAIPHVITESGSYCLTGSLAGTITTGTAIVIDAPDVVLDLNGFTLAGHWPGIGISVKSWKNVTVRNGTVRGFATGVTLAPVEGRALSVVEDIRAQDNRVGIDSAANGALIRRCQVGVPSSGAPSPAPHVSTAIGIRIGGVGSRALDNDLWGGGGVGIQVSSGCPRCVVEDNRIDLDPNGSTGVEVDAVFADGVAIVNNRIGADIGIRCQAGDVLSACYLKDNLVHWPYEPYLGEFVDAGGNFPVVP